MTKDDFQTPTEALTPLLPYLPPYARLWEPACGKGNLVRALREQGHIVQASDLQQTGVGISGLDFLEDSPRLKPVQDWADIIVTNPPYSVLDKWLARCFEIGKPFALLLPLYALGAQERQRLYRAHGEVSAIMLGRRVVMETPTGKTDTQSNPQFEAIWVTWNLPTLPNGRIVFTEMPRCP